MNDLIFNEPNHILNFRFWCQKVLPLVYDDSLSYYELLCKVVNYLNKVIDETNKIGADITELYKAYNQLKEYVDNYFKNLDVQEEINKKLDEMAKNGFFSNIAKYFIVSTALNPIYMRNTGHKHYYKYSEETSAIYGAYQGFTNTHNTFIGMLIPIEYKLNYITGSITNKAVIVEYDNNMRELRRSGELTLYHGSAMFFYDNKIYVNANSSGEEYINKIIVVDYQTLTVVNEIEIDMPSNWVFVKDGLLYTGTRSHLEKRELDGTLISSTDLKSKGLPAIHSCKPFEGGGYIATINNFNMILLLDTDFNITKTFAINGKVGLQGEIKDIAFMNGNIFIPYNDRSYVRYSDSELSETYIGVLKFNVYSNLHEQNIGVGSDYSNAKNIYVDTSTTSELQDGSSSNPYATILQAVRNGARQITLVNSNGCAIFGTDISLFINSSSKENTVIFDFLNNCKITGSYITLNDSVNGNLLKGCDISLPNSNINATLNVNYCNLNFDSPDYNIKEGALSNLLMPEVNKISSAEQKWFAIANSNKLTLGFDEFSHNGIYIGNLKINADGTIFSSNFCSPISTLLSQYITCVTRSDGTNKTLTCYCNFVITNGVLSVNISNSEIDGTNVNCVVERIALSHII